MSGRRYFIYDGDNDEIASWITVSGYEDADLYFSNLKFKQVSYLKFILYILLLKVRKLYDGK